jgi:hypothetical protein
MTIHLVLKIIVSAIYAIVLGVIILNSISLATGRIFPIIRILFILSLFTLFVLL